MNDEQATYLLNFFRHVKKDSDPEISILKSHLLIESLANDFVSKKICRPEFIQKMNLRYFQTILLARALDNSPIADWAWEAAERLNSIRNSLSHELRPKDLEAKMANLIEFVDSKTKILEGFEEDFGPFITRIIRVWVCLCAHLHYDPSAFSYHGKTLLTR
jgi:hypothetical protein